MTLSLNNTKDIICDSLYLLDTNNVLQNVLTLIGSGSNGNGGIVRSVLAPLDISTSNATFGQLSINLGDYSTTAQINTLLGNKEDSLTPGANINISSNNVISSTGLGLVQSVLSPLELPTTGSNVGELSINLGDYSTTVEIISRISNELSNYTDTVNMTTLLNGKQIILLLATT